MTASIDDEMRHPRNLIETQESQVTNPNGGPAFLRVVRARMDRRGFLRSSGATVTAALIGGGTLSACGGSAADDPVAALPGASASTRIDALGFAAVAKSRSDALIVPAGYSAGVLYRTGDPIATGVAAYGNVGTDDPATYGSRSGDCHDGIEYFGLTDAGAVPTADGVGNHRGMLAMNHEYITQQFLHAAAPTNMSGPLPRPADEVFREVAMHGVSIVEVWKQSAGAFSATGTWVLNPGSARNRRITAATRVEIAGPGRGHASMVTKFSPGGEATRGTLNNCGAGSSFWGTFLTCEENWAGYFLRPAADNANRTPREVVALGRYSVGGDRYRWGTRAAATAAAMAAHTVGSAADADDRWNSSVVAAAAAQDYRNVHNTFGWVVEIDPYDVAAVPKKRTAMGRFAHEAAVGLAPVVGQPLAFYMGDDSRGDYIYKFVSTEPWNAADAYPANRMAIGDKYLDRGTLYAARFDADGTGAWLPLTLAAVQAAQAAAGGTPAYVFADAFDVLQHCRLAADVMGATRMDRPEWGAVNPRTREIYFTLTENNSSAANATSGQTGRRPDNLDAANPRFYADAREATGSTTPGTNTGNPFGHIIRFKEADDRTSATAFTWDVFLFGSQADADPARVNLSGLSSANDFARADGLWFSPTTGLGWVQTDDSGAFLDQSNCMMLAAVAGRVGDGRRLAREAPSAVAVGSTPAGAQRAATAVGAPFTETTLRRFLVGPRDQEITGVTETPDGRAMFVNVQHPGEDTPPASITAGAGDFTSYWPGPLAREPGTPAVPTGSRPRSATVVITKNDGGLIGS